MVDRESLPAFNAKMIEEFAEGRRPQDAAASGAAVVGHRPAAGAHAAAGRLSERPA